MGRINRRLPGALLAALALVGCRKEATTAPTAQTIVATLSLSRLFAAPGDTVLATVGGTPSAGIEVALLHLKASGLVNADESLVVVGPGFQSFSHAFILPLQPASGSVSFVGSASAGSVQGTAQQTLPVYDSIPPVVSQVQLRPTASVQRGDSVYVDFVASDNAGVAHAIVHWTGAFTRTDTVAAPVARTMTGHLAVRVPADARIGVAMNAGVEAVDVAGNRASAAAAPVLIVDLRPPALSGTATGSTPGTLLGLGDTLIISLNASDDDAVAWIGYGLGAPASVSDSVAVTGASGAHVFRLPAAPGWAGSFYITAFARDSAGNRATVNLGSMTGVNATRRPLSALPLTAAVSDIAYDRGRDALYVSLPDSNLVAVVRRNPFAYDAPIATPSRPQGLDLTLSGDSLVVALRRSAYLGVVNLAAATRTVDTVRLSAAGGGVGPDHVRMAANGQLLVTMTFDGSGYGGCVYAVNLATGTQRRRSDAGFYGEVTEAVPLAAAGDRSAIFGLIDDSCCPEDGFVYDAATDSIPVLHGTVGMFFPSVSADTTGAHVLIANSLYDRALSLHLSYTPSGYGYGPTALAPDGSVVYMGVDNAYVKLRASDGAELQRTLLPGTPSRLLVLPDGRGLVAVVPSQLVLVPQP